MNSEAATCASQNHKRDVVYLRGLIRKSYGPPGLVKQNKVSRGEARASLGHGARLGSVLRDSLQRAALGRARGAALGGASLSLLDVEGSLDGHRGGVGGRLGQGTRWVQQNTQ